MFRKLLSAINPTHRKAEMLAEATFFLQSKRAIICNQLPDQQLLLLNKDISQLFQLFDIIAQNNIHCAVKLFLDLSKSLSPKALTTLWGTAAARLPTAIAKHPESEQDKAYLYILSHAPRGYIADMIIDNPAPFGRLIAAAGNKRDTDFFNMLVSHAPPKSSIFLDTYETNLISLYKTVTGNRLSLVKSLLKACDPQDGKSRPITPPAYLEEMRREQICDLIRSIWNYHTQGDNGFKRISTCLQELRLLKAEQTDLLQREKSTKTAKSDKLFYLYRLPKPANFSAASSNEPTHLYALLDKPIGYGIHDDSGKTSTILLTTELGMVVRAFDTLAYDLLSKNTVAGLAARYGYAPPSPKIQNSFSQANPPYKVTTYFQSDIVPLHSFKLTGCSVTLNSDNDQSAAAGNTQPNNWHPIPFQQHQP